MIMMVEPEDLGKLVRISGVHISDVKGKPIEGVMVTCKNIQDGHMLSGLTDVNGDVELE